MDRKVYNFWVLEAPYKTGVETVLRGYAAIYPMVSCCDIRRRRDRHSIRVSALQRVLAAHSRSWSKMPARIRSANHNGFEWCHHWSSACLLSYSYCHEVSHAIETVGRRVWFPNNISWLITSQQNFAGSPFRTLFDPDRHHHLPCRCCHRPTLRSTVSLSGCIPRDTRCSRGLKCPCARIFCSRSWREETALQVWQCWWI